MSAEITQGGTASPGYDVVIVGMGPVGKLVALLLAKAGHSVAIVEKKEQDYPLPRAVGHDSEIARLLQGAGFPVDGMPEAVEAYDDLYVWVNAAGEVIQQIDLRGSGESGWANQYFYHQPALEARLDAALRSRDDVTVLRGFTAHVGSQDDDSVSILLSPVTAGDGLELRARYVLGADGANSSTRRDAGIGWHDLGFHFDWLVVDVAPGPGVEVTHLAKQVCDPVRPTTVVPGGPGRRRWEFMLLDGEDPNEMAKPDRVWELLSSFGVTPDNSTVDRGVVYTFAAGWAEAWRAGRVLLVGDAAHLMPPFAAQGLASGFRDAANLAWKLDLVMRGLAADSLLDTYGSERVNHVKEFIDFSIFLGQVICITDPEVAAGRDLQMITAIQQNAVPAPPPAPRLGAGLHEGERGGTLSRQGLITTSETTTPTRFDDVFGSGALIVRGPHADLGSTIVGCLDSLGIAVVDFDVPGRQSTFEDVDGVYGAWFDEWAVSAVLIRPDLTVYGTVAEGDAATGVVRLAERFISAVHAPPATTPAISSSLRSET